MTAAGRAGNAVSVFVAWTPGTWDDLAWIGVRLACASAVAAKRQAVARSAAVRVLAVAVGFGVTLLPRWARWLPAVLLAIPGPADELAFIALVAVVVAARPALRRQLAASLRMAVGARYLTAAAERIA